MIDDDRVWDEVRRVVKACRLEVRGEHRATVARRAGRGSAGGCGEERGVRSGLDGEAERGALGEEEVARALVGHAELRGAQQQLADGVAARSQHFDDACTQC